MAKYVLRPATPGDRAAAKLAVELFGLGVSFLEEPTDAELEEAAADLAIGDAAVMAVVEPSKPLEQMLPLAGRDARELEIFERSTERHLLGLRERAREDPALASSARRVAKACRRIRGIVQALRRPPASRPARAGAARVIRFARPSGRRTRTARTKTTTRETPAGDGPTPTPAREARFPRLVVTAADLDDEGAENLVQLFRLLHDLKAKRRNRTNDADGK